MITHKFYSGVVQYMNKSSIKIASFIDSQNKGIESCYNLSGLSESQIQAIKTFLKEFNRTGPIPFPLKWK